MGCFVFLSWLSRSLSQVTVPDPFSLCLNVAPDHCLRHCGPRNNEIIRVWSGRRALKLIKKHKVVKSKTHRKKAFTLGVALDHVANKCIGKRFQNLVLPEEDRTSGQDAWTWELGHIATDKGPDCSCFANFLRWPAWANVEWHWGPSHGATASIRFACAKAGLACHSYLSLLSYNAGCGEWKNGERREQVRTSIARATAANTPSSDAAWHYVQTRFPSADITEADEMRRYQALKLHGGSWQHDLARVSTSKYFGLRERFVTYERSYWQDILCG